MDEFDTDAALCDCKKYCNLQESLLMKKVKELEKEKRLIWMNYATYKGTTRMASIKKEELYEEDLARLISEINRCNMLYEDKCENVLHVVKTKLDL